MDHGQRTRLPLHRLTVGSIRERTTSTVSDNNCFNVFCSSPSHQHHSSALVHRPMTSASLCRKATSHPRFRTAGHCVRCGIVSSAGSQCASPGPCGSSSFASVPLRFATERKASQSEKVTGPTAGQT